LFNIDDLCPTNAPKRCEWCKGPYHIRKRCPKLATLANENEKKKRIMNNFEQQRYMDKNSYRHSNNNNINGRNYPKSAPPNQHPFRYANEDRSREYYNSNEQQRNNNSHRSYNRRGCFECGQFDHMKANCPLLKKTNSVYQKTSSS